ncbi:hypothetical protein LEP1GSC127_1107 [Leptospira kirschneri str. 200801925]|uniref:Uncharacterized protein n=2 Tax=Leptospira kirschneri TaxID=29507 RepID=A0A828Y3L4_9LEPT|nr:hypothetical protein LEP1GSC044_2581 [Leptospira kirschneri serovar Grippotyphosa str. RM52]EKO51529.1 hypothetical protein LEP1GSC131_0416 [Leptospira kirschneri str. 200802841]EKP03355.1 hypothetical protein LEP1GSC018_3354 [Leptospira kirschneri str. 2008720114]EMK25167.1 hypothetical protein LEP1GSC008_4441 [Leptospira kirschneri serovar Bulgarica str. Nikolaevo]EMO74774.1 hypothetical protein LEP1GSC127_1107 [Leptospira kirschneri str. 200801925]EMO81350.1 hypothetical protein LEP1GSC1
MSVSGQFFSSFLNKSSLSENLCPGYFVFFSSNVGGMYGFSKRNGE